MDHIGQSGLKLNPNMYNFSTSPEVLRSELFGNVDKCADYIETANMNNHIIITITH